MQWKGKEVRTIDDVMHALRHIGTKKEAAEYLRLSRLESPHADENIGYLFGYFSRERWKELSELFDISHPVFGNNFTLTDDEIMQMGIERGKAMMAKRNGQE